MGEYDGFMFVDINQKESESLIYVILLHSDLMGCHNDCTRHLKITHALLEIIAARTKTRARCLPVPLSQ